MKSRTRARSVALQVLFETDIVGHPPSEVFQQRVNENNLEPKLVDFAHAIVFGVLPIRNLLDKFIIEHASEWPIDQVAIIDRNILRIALWEFAVYKKTPVKVAINEAIELAKTFGSESTPRFINGVLGSLVAQLNAIQTTLEAAIKGET